MGVYTTNRCRVAGINVEDIPANESYMGSAGAERIIAETYINDMSIFEAVLKQDIHEIMNKGTLLESEMEAITEASAKGMADAIKKTLSGWYSKIKGLIEKFVNGFVEKVHAANVKLIDQAKKVIDKKEDLSGIKYKWRSVSRAVKDDYNFKSATETIGNVYKKAWNELDHSTAFSIDDDLSNYKDGSLVNKMLSAYISTVGTGSGTTLAEFDKDFDALHIGSVVETKTGMTTDFINQIVASLKDFHNLKARWQNEEKRVAQLVKEGLADVDEQEKAVEGSKNDVDFAQKRLNALRMCLNAYQTATVKAVNANMRMQKVYVGQSRAALMKAVMASGKAPKKEEEKVAEAAMMEWVDECVECELDELMG